MKNNFIFGKGNQEINKLAKLKKFALPAINVSGTNTIKNFEKLLCKFKSENPSIPVNLKVLTRKDMWKSIYTFKRYKSIITIY